MQKVKNAEKVWSKIKKFYRGSEIVLPPKSERRHFRFQCVTPSGRLVWRKIKDRIDTKEKLRKHLIKNCPLNAYCTISKWLNPTVLGRKDEQLHKNLFIGSDFLFDIDQDFMDGGKKITKNIYEKLLKMGYSRDELRIVFTGGGSHIHIFDFFENKDNIENPREREEKCKEKMLEFIKKFQGIDKKSEKDYLFDYGVANDTRRIRKVPNTITKYGNISRAIKPEEIESFKPNKILNIKKKEPLKLVEW